MLKLLGIGSLCAVLGLVAGVAGSRQVRSVYDDSSGVVVCVPKQVATGSRQFRIGDSGCSPDETTICVAQRSELLEADTIKVGECRASSS